MDNQQFSVGTPLDNCVNPSTIVSAGELKMITTNESKYSSSLFAIQVALEEESTALGQLRYQRQQERLQGSDRAADSGVLAAAVRRHTQVLAEAIEARRTAAPTIGRRARALVLMEELGLESEALAFLTLRCCSVAATVERRVSTIATQLAGELINEWNFRRFKNVAPDSYDSMQKSVEKKVAQTRFARRVTVHESGHWDTMEMADRTQLGMWLMDLMIEVTGLFTIDHENRGKAKQELMVLRPTQQFVDWLRDGHERAAMMRPVMQPMVHPPQDWAGPTGGGYLSTAIAPLQLVRTPNKQYLHSLAAFDMSEVYAAVNAIQSTAWKINENVLDVMVQCWDRGIEVGALVNGEPTPTPEFPQQWEGKVKVWKEQDPQGYKAWALRSALIHQANDKLLSKRCAAMTKMETAKKFRGYSAIYFPHNLDFRGRIYPVVPGLQPQGDDIAKGLLCFSEGKPLGERGAYWLKVHIANCFGVDKVAFAERVRWVEDRMEALLDSAIDPLNAPLWKQADDPWQALAACFDLLGWSINGADHVSHLSIPMDGSCNGLQNFSALLKDSVGGKATNLIPQEKPADIYSEVARVVQEQVHLDAQAGNTHAILWDGNVNRKIVKQPVMTLPYGATMSGMQRQIEDALRKHNPTLFPTHETWGACSYLAGVTYEAIGRVVIAARAAMDWLRETAKIAAREDYPVRWTTPMGFPVVQDYRETEGYRVQVHIRGKASRLIMQRTGDKLSRRRQSAGISPNLIHSYDAAHLMRTVLLAKENGLSSFAFIHDSYGTHACNTDLLHACLREAFIEQYSQPLLEKFRQEICDQLPPEAAAEIPPVPESGDLDLAVIRESRYFFA